MMARDAPPPPDLVAHLKPNKAEIRASPLEGGTGTNSRSADKMAVIPRQRRSSGARKVWRRDCRTFHALGIALAFNAANATGDASARTRRPCWKARVC